jgi:hypothetical protein
VELYVAAPDNVGQSSLRRPHNYTGVALKVPCGTLDEYVEEHRIHRVDLIKIDVEGAELSVLRGARKTLSRMKPSLIVEFWDEFQTEYGTSCAEMGAFLKELGYKLFWITDSGLLPYAQSTGISFNVLGQI